MKNKKQSTYLYNARKSIGVLGGALLDDYVPNSRSNIGTLKDGIKSVTATGGGSAFSGIKTKLKNNPIVQFTQTATKSAFNGLKTGKFYTDPLDFDDSEFDAIGDLELDDSFFFAEGDEFTGDGDVQTSRPVGDSSTVDTGTQATIASANKISETIQGSITEGDRALIDTSINVSRALAESLSNTIISVGADLKAVLSKTDVTVSNQFEFIKSLANMNELSLKTSSEVLVELKALREMSGDYMLAGGKEKEKDNNDHEPIWYQALKKGDFLGGGKNILDETIRAVDSRKTQGVFGTLMNMAPLLMTVYATNPMGLIKDFWLNNKLNEKFGLQDFTNKFDDRLKSIPDMIDGAARTLSLSDNDIMRSVGDAVRTKPDVTSSIATDKYEKHKKVFFDGMTREAIVTVIPTYLASMVSLLSGKERTTYDYSRGQFQTMGEVKAKFYEEMPKLEFEYSRLAKLIKENLGEEYKDGMDEKKIDNFSQVMMERMSERGYTLSNFKDTNYDKALEILNLNTDQFSESDFMVMRSLLAKLETDEDTYARFGSLNKAMESYLKSRNSYMKEAAKNARDTGLIHTVNKSWSMDNGSAVGLKALANGTGVPGATTPSGIKYEHLLNDVGRSTMDDVTLNREYLTEADKQKDISLFGRQLSSEEIESVRNHDKERMGGAKRIFRNMGHNAQLILKSKMFEKFGVHDKEWYEDFQDYSDYSLEDILSGKLAERSIRDAGVEEIVVEAHLEDAGVDKETAKEISKIIADDTVPQEQKSEIIKDALSKKGFFDKASDKMKTISKSVKDTFNSTKDKIKSTTDSVIGTVKDHKKTIMAVSKAALFGGAAITGFNMIKSTGLGQLAGAFGLMSPIAMGSVALGAGLYAHKKDLFGQLFGDNEKAKATGKKMLGITKTALFGAGVTGGLSGLLTLATGGAFGMMAPVSMAISGLALGIAGENKNFKKMMFGTEEGSFMSNMKVWLLGDKAIGKEGLLSKYGAGVKDFLKNTSFKMKRFFEVDIVKPITDMYRPVSDFIAKTGNSLLSAITGIPTKIGDSLSTGLKTTVMAPLMQKLDESFITPIGSFVKGIFSKGGSIFGKILSAPFKIMKALITGRTEKDDFTSSFGSSSTDSKGKFTGDQQEYNKNMTAKKNLYDKTKYMTKDEVSNLSTKEQKQVRKFKVKEAQEKQPEVQESKPTTLQERLASYKDYKRVFVGKEKEGNVDDYVANRGARDLDAMKNYKKYKEKEEEDAKGKGIFGKGIDLKTSKKYYYNQKDGSFKNIVFGSGGVNMNTHGCGIMVISQAISIALNEKIKPEHIAKDVGTFQSGTDGINHTFFSYICGKYAVPSTTYSKPDRKIIDGALRRKASIIVTMEDLETKEPHYILITDGKMGEYIYSDPAREANMRMAKGAILANITSATVIFKAEKSKPSNISAPKMEENGSEKVHSSVDYNNKQVFDKYDASERDEGKTYRRYKSNPNEKARITDKAAGNSAKGESSLLSKIYKSLEKFRKNSADASADIRDDIEIFLSGVAYNVEYMRRILEREYGSVSDKDITGTSHTIDVLKRYSMNIGKQITRLFRKGIDSIKEGMNFLYDQTVGRVMRIFDNVASYIGKKVKGFFDGLNKAVDFVIGIPEKVAKGIGKFAKATTEAIKAIIPSKETMLATYNELKGFVKGTYGEIKDFTKFTFGEIKSAATYTIDKVGKMANFAMDKMTSAAIWLGQAAKTTFNTVKDWSGKAFEWFKGTTIGHAVMNPVATMKAGWQKLKGKVEINMSPKEVFVTGGTLNTIQTVEVVKAVGAVDLDYSESMSKKLKGANDVKGVIDAMNTQKSAAPVVSRAKSPNPKTGAEYSTIKDRQDKETDITIQQTQAEEKKEEKPSFFSKMLDNFKAFAGGMIPAITMAISGALGGLSLGATTDKGHELITKGYNMLGVDGDYNADRLETRGYRMMTKFGAETAVKVAKQGLPKIKDMAKNLFDPKKCMTTVSKSLRDLFVSPKIRGLLGEKFCTAMLKLIPNIAKKGAQEGTKKAAKGALRMSAYALPPVGIALDIAFLAWDVTTGMMNDASRLFGVKSKDLTAKMRAIAGAVKGMQGFLASKGPLLVLAFIPTDWLVKYLYSNIADENEKAEFEKNQAEYNTEVEKEMAEMNSKREAEGKAPMTKEEFLDYKHRGLFSKAKDYASEKFDNVSSFVSDGWSKTKQIAGNAWDKAKDVGSKAWDVAKDVGGKAFMMTPMGMMYKGIKAIYEAFSENGFLGGIGALAGKLVNTVEGVYESVKNFFTGDGFLSKMIDYVKDIPNTIKEFMGNIHTGIINFGINMVDNIQKIPEKMVEFGGHIVDGIQKIPGYLYEGAKNIGNFFIDGLITAKDKLFDFGFKIYEVVTGIPAYLKDIWTSIIELPSRIYNWGKEKVTDVVDTVKGGLLNIKDKVLGGYNKERAKKKPQVVEPIVEEKPLPLLSEITTDERNEIKNTISKPTPIVSEPVTPIVSTPEVIDVNKVEEDKYAEEMRKIEEEGRRLRGETTPIVSEPVSIPVTPVETSIAPVVSTPLVPESIVPQKAQYEIDYENGMASIEQRMEELRIKQAEARARQVEDEPLSAYGPLDFFEKLDDNFITNLVNFGRTPKSDSTEMGGASPYGKEPMQDMNYDYGSLKPKSYTNKNADQIRDMYHTAKDTYGEKIASNLVRIAWAESNWNHTAKNSIGAEGLFQVLKSTRPAWGFSANESPREFSPVEQMQRVAPKLLGMISRKGAEPNLLNMYSALHYPISVGKPSDWVLYGKNKDPKAYAGNKGIDLNYGNKDGNVSMNEMNNFVMAGAKQADSRFKTLGGYGDITTFISQASSRWSKMSMGPFSFKDAGCGPSVMAMLLDSLGIKYDMNYLVERAVQAKNGLLDGTPMTYFRDILSEYRVASEICTDSVQGRFLAEMRAGKNPILLTVSSTGSNHYIIGKDMKGDSIGINDPEKSSTEYVSMEDNRIRKAKAILVYKARETKSILKSSVADIVGGAYGSLRSILSPYKNAHNSVLGNIESKVIGKLDKVVGKNDITRKVARDFVNTNMSSVKSLADTISNPINDVTNALGNIEDNVRGGIGRTTNGIKSLTNQPIESLRDVQKVINETKTIIKDATKLAVEVPNMAGAIKDGIPKQSNSFNSSNIESKLDRMCDLLSALVKNTMPNAKSITVNHNGKEVYNTVGGRPTPLANANDGDKFFDLVNRVSMGSI